MRSPASDTSTPGKRAARIRLSTAFSTCSATVRPKRAVHACGIWSVLVMVPVAVPSDIRTYADGVGFESVSVTVSPPSSCSSFSTGTETVFEVSNSPKVSVPEVAV